MDKGYLMGDSLELKDGYILHFGRKVAKVTKKEETEIDCVCGAHFTGKSRFMFEEMETYKKHFSSCKGYELYTL